jgi:hypothetical protein
MQLTNAQWQEACQLFEEITQLISDIIQTTCTAPPFPQLTNNTNRLGGFLPRKLQNQWKKHLTKHHLTRKIIYIVKNNPNWRQHPILYQLTSIDAPSTPASDLSLPNWIHELAAIGKQAQKDARLIITKHNKKSAQKAIAKFQTLITLKQETRASFKIRKPHH